jgi:hypothetical protein
MQNCAQWAVLIPDDSDESDSESDQFPNPGLRVCC